MPLISIHFEATAAGTREGSDWADHWDEASDPVADAATTLAIDEALSSGFSYFDGDPWYDGTFTPSETAWTEATSGQFFLDPSNDKRGPFADHLGRGRRLAGGLRLVIRLALGLGSARLIVLLLGERRALTGAALR